MEKFADRVALLLAACILAAVQFCVPDAHAVELPILRDLICHYETRGESNPDMAVGQDAEIGRCQIKLSTARLVGYRGTRSELLHAEINRLVALDILDRCATIHRGRVRRVIWCYRAGFSSGEIDRVDRYTKMVEMELARLTMPRKHGTVMREGG